MSISAAIHDRPMITTGERADDRRPGVPPHRRALPAKGTDHG